MNVLEQPACSRSNLEILRLRANASLAGLIRLLRAYPPSIEELRPYVRFDPAGYTRNIVGESDLYRLLVLSWLPGQVSPIHDHAGSTCAVLVISGTATETRYALTPAGLARPTGTSVYGPGTVFGGQDADIHALGNCRSDGTGLITCHIYSPPLVHMNFYDAEDSPLALAAAR